MISSVILWQRNFDMYRRKALENGFTEEEVDSVEQRLKWLYRHGRPLQMPRQLDLIWAAHRLLCIEREMNSLFY